MIGTLCWKEYREQRGLWVAIVILAVASVAGLETLALGGTVQPGDAETIKLILIVELTGLVVGHGVLCGANLLAGDKETGTLAFLDTLAPRRTPVWQTKLVTGCLLTASQALFLAGMAVFFYPDCWLTLPLYLAISLVGLLAGMAAGTICRSVFPAILLGAGLTLATPVLGVLAVGVLFRFLDPSAQHEPTAMPLLIFMNLAASGLVGYISWRWYCKNDDERLPASLGPSSFLQGGSRLFALRRGIDSLWWLALRQGRWVIVPGLAISFITGFYFNQAVALIWPIANLVIGIACGACVFAFEQPGEQERFLGVQRFPPGRVWLWRMVFWACAALLMVLMLLVVPLLGDTHSQPLGKKSFDNLGILWYCYYRHANSFLTMWVVHGFCIGQFFALLSRRIIVTLVFAAAASVCCLVVWLPAIIFGGINGWHVFGVPLLLLLAGRLTVWTWFSGRLFSRWHLCGLAGCGLLSILWLSGCLWYRAVEIPDVGEPFDLAEYRQELTAAAQSKAGLLIREAAKEMDGYVKTITAKRKPPTRPIFPEPKAPAGAPAPLKLDYLVMSDDILSKGWPSDDAEIGPFFDAVFAGPWANDFRKAAKMPLGLVVDPRTVTRDSLLPEVQTCRLMAFLFSIRALQLQAHGDDDAALEHLETVLALSRQIRHDTISFPFLVGSGMEHSALSGLDRWLVNIGRPDQLRRALDMLGKHEALVPDAQEVFKAEYVSMLCQMERDPAMYYSPSRAATEMDKVLAYAAWEIPWERQRQFRIVNAVFQGVMYRAKSSPRNGQDWDSDLATRIAAVYGLPLPEGPTTRLSGREWGTILMDSALLDSLPNLYRVSEKYSLTRIRVRQLFLALALYKAEHNKPAAKLDDLVPAYFPALPRDPIWNRPFSYRISSGEDVTGGDIYSSNEKKDKLLPGQGVIWMVNAEQQHRATDVWYFPVPQWSKNKEAP